MNIKQALKRKNVLINEIKKEYAKIVAYNSVDVGNKRPYSAKVALDNYLMLTDELIELKTAIHIANMPVYGKIFRLSELKSMIKYLSVLNCNEGKESPRYGGTVDRVLEVEISIVNRDVLVNTLEAEIDSIQDQLDLHNATTELAPIFVEIKEPKLKF